MPRTSRQLLLGVVTRRPNESHGVQGVAGSNPAVPTRPPPCGGGLVVTACLPGPLAFSSRPYRSNPAVPTQATFGPVVNLAAGPSPHPTPAPCPSADAGAQLVPRETP